MNRLSAFAFLTENLSTFRSRMLQLKLLESSTSRQLSEGFAVSNVLHRGELRNRATLDRAAMDPPAVDKGPLASDVFLHILWMLCHCHVNVPGFQHQGVRGQGV